MAHLRYLGILDISSRSRHRTHKLSTLSHCTRHKMPFLEYLICVHSLSSKKIKGASYLCLCSLNSFYFMSQLTKKTKGPFISLLVTKLVLEIACLIFIGKTFLSCPHDVSLIWDYCSFRTLRNGAF